jgi:hypothetical protein
MILLEDFTNPTAWEKDDSISIADGKVTNTETGYKWLWHELPEPLDPSMPFRLTCLVNVGKDIPIHIGLINADGLENPKTFNNPRLFWGGYSTTNSRPQWRLGDFLTGVGSDLPSTGLYKFTFVSDGVTQTFSIEDPDDKNIEFDCRFRGMEQSQYTHIAIRFTGSSDDTWVEQLAFRTGFGDFGNEDFESRLKFVTTTDETGLEPNTKCQKDRTSLVVLPKPIGDAKHRLLIFSHGHSGDWKQSNKAFSNYFLDNMADEGYISCSMDCTNHNGHWKVTTQAFLTRKRLFELGFNMHYKMFTMGLSMGALYACNMATDYPDLVARICLIGGHSNLLWRYLGIHGVNRGESVDETYDCDESTFSFKTRGRNPYENLHKLVRYPLLAIHNDETHVEPIFAEKIVENLNALGGDATYILNKNSSVHNDINLYNVETIAGFFNQSTDEDLARPAHVKYDISGAVRIS